MSNTPQSVESDNTFEQNVPELGMQDIAITVQLLHLAIKRGAYEPQELATVGITYEKLNTFMQHQAQIQQAARVNQEGGA